MNEYPNLVGNFFPRSLYSNTAHMGDAPLPVQPAASALDANSALVSAKSSLSMKKPRAAMPASASDLRSRHPCAFCDTSTQWICFGVEHAASHPYACCTSCAIPSSSDLEDGKSALQRSEATKAGVCPTCVLGKPTKANLVPVDPTADTRRRKIRNKLYIQSSSGSDSDWLVEPEAASTKAPKPSKKATGRDDSRKVVPAAIKTTPKVCILY